MSGNLGITQIAATQNQKEVTANAALLRLDAAMTDLLSVSVSAGNATLTAAQFQTAVAFVIAGATVAGRTMTVPASRRLFVVLADAANTQAIAVARGTTLRSLAPGQSALLYTDGTANGLSVVSHSSLSGLRNRIINPAMQISQQRGTALVDCTTGATYAVDQWVALLSAVPGGTLRMQQIASPTPAGSPWRLRATAQVADTSLAAGDFYIIGQPIEGRMIADASFGSSAARQLLVRFGLRSSLAGTFGVSLRNSAANRTWLGTVTVAADEVNTDLVREIAIAGDSAGTWLTDAGVGLQIYVALAAGTTFQGAVGWQAGNFLTTSAQTNFMGTAGATFELFDVGLYVDTLGLRLFPPFEVPPFDEDLRACQRYYSLTYAASFFEATAASQAGIGLSSFPVEMRAVPSIATVSIFQNQNLQSSLFDQVTIRSARLVIISAAAGSAAGAQVFSATARL